MKYPRDRWVVVRVFVPGVTQDPWEEDPRALALGGPLHDQVNESQGVNHLGRCKGQWISTPHKQTDRQTERQTDTDRCRDKETAKDKDSKREGQQER